LVRAHP